MRFIRDWMELSLLAIIAIEVPGILCWALWPSIVQLMPYAAQVALTMVGLIALAGLEWAVWPMMRDVWRRL